mmetsp:Transcript_22170/g.32986  ORF Transcript_22170/g.32986 Transcript_22170/m.32986 type:complete len:313 (+) Transcript_22170:55-993(+)|eukprot:CAMPEP_0201548674 /NCGR_PEP_ID=MMETSP0173_2-20130828/5203_1 /ASSEMBLY_ACC=CAM_ASM_000268 /TAXON_ID=218659 /ORGANISM="Vexillifera sp., Strain DIVA3 564/2" /LENGTH=312 /DNA_ID=CAMNT_0047958121 /DNA_START=49 /DNA_END=987 /DNA_ORIENTATION=-
MSKKGKNSFTTTTTTSSSSGDGLHIQIHPLTLMNITDHFTRSKVATGKPQRVIGGMLGTQKARSVSIHTSFDSEYTIEDSKIKINWSKFKQKFQLLQRVLPEFEFIGWYSTGQKSDKQDLQLHQEVVDLEFNENPIYLTFNDQIDTSSESLPIDVYETEVKLVHGKPQTQFVRGSWQLDSEESERIAVNEIARVKTADTMGGSKLTSHLGNIKNALAMLLSRIEGLEHYLEQVEKNAIPRDHAALRQISAICAQLPAIEGEQFHKDLAHEYNDALLVTYLSSITKGTTLLEILATKYEQAYGNQHKQFKKPM